MACERFSYRDLSGAGIPFYGWSELRIATFCCCVSLFEKGTLSGLAITVTICSVDHSLSARLIVGVVI